MSAQIEHKVTIQQTHNMTWAQLQYEAKKAGVPEHARISTYHYAAGASRDPRETSYTNIIFTWHGNANNN